MTFAAFDDNDMGEFCREVVVVAHTAETTHDYAPVRECLEAWLRTAQALADPEFVARHRAGFAGDGPEILRPLPERERLSPELRASLERGIRQAEAGELVSLGSFAEYLEDDDGP